ncbi:aromatic-ring hydroxylase C-terminal domain-containing protein [Streptomyces poonensis]|uniref:aromatic-ring hydroxylase C-terminal domain-containing protein n=1 Tax=Streptomyces poonensis TaxID=68255 RepID=UPI003570D65C
MMHLYQVNHSLTGMLRPPTSATTCTFAMTPSQGPLPRTQRLKTAQGSTNLVALLHDGRPLLVHTAQAAHHAELVRPWSDRLSIVEVVPDSSSAMRCRLRRSSSARTGRLHLLECAGTAGPDSGTGRGGRGVVRHAGSAECWCARYPETLLLHGSECRQWPPRSSGRSGPQPHGRPCRFAIRQEAGPAVAAAGRRTVGGGPSPGSGRSAVALELGCRAWASVVRLVPWVRAPVPGSRRRSRWSDALGRDRRAPVPAARAPW